MKKILMTTAVLVFLTCVSFADPLVNFAGTPGSQSITQPSSYTLSTYAPTPTWHITPETVTFTADGTGSCHPGVCSGTSNHVWEMFSTLSYATYLTSAPNQVTTTATYYLNGHVVDVTNQVGGPVWHPRAPGFMFDELELSWAGPTKYRFSFQSFDAVPEPSSLILLGSGLLAGVNVLRKKSLK